MRIAELLKCDVEDALRYEPRIHAERIGVSVNRGVVELDGHVDSFYEKWAAEDAAIRVANVESIASEIIVDLPFASKRTDIDIAFAAGNQLAWNILVPDTIKVVVVDGNLTLQGTAEWRYQREEAESTVRSLHGVKSIVNEIALTARISPVNVKVNIQNALRRDAQIDSEQVKVEVNGSSVTLSGNVSSWRERRDAEHAAFDAPGVGCVVNRIEISN
jgi:osmotically-inducible protein OsmY